MNIIVIIGSVGLGGLERVSLNLSKWFNEQESCRGTIVALSKPKYNKYNLEGYDFVELNSKHPVLALRKYVKRHKPDIVLTMGVPLCIFTVPALMGLGVKHIISERNDPAHFEGKTSTRIIARTLMRLADGYVFQTMEARDYYGGNIAKHSEIIHNPLLKLPEETVMCEAGSKKEIVSVGRLNKQKNQQLLIEAFADICEEFPSYTLKIYGDGPERDRLQLLINDHALQSRVQLPGSTTEIIDKIRPTSLFVLSSIFEGMPNALMEAMALGIPCISTDCPCGGPRELIRNGENGILIPVGDKASLTEAMRKLMNDIGLYSKISQNAKSIRQSHSLDIICKQWFGYFQAVLGK